MPRDQWLCGLVLLACAWASPCQNLDPTAPSKEYIYIGGKLIAVELGPKLSVTVTADSVTPLSGSGSSQTFALQYSDTFGSADLTQAWVWINANSTTAANSCMAYYDKASNGIYLLTDGGHFWTARSTLGATGTLSNSQCSINLTSSSVVNSGTHLTLNLAITFTGAYAGAKNVYMYGTNGTVSSGWQTLGTWSVP